MHNNESISTPTWLTQLAEKRGEKSIHSIQYAIELYSSHHQHLLPKALIMADILLSLGLDNETLASAIIYPILQAGDIHLDTITDHFGESHRKLLRDVMQMQSLGKLQQLHQRPHHQLENLRKMLLAMVTDVRAVLIILAERLWQLREAKQQEVLLQQQLARETLAIYAPLANRLGIGQLKWEMEDLCLRFLNPDIYQKIAKWLASRRAERETYVKQVIDTLTSMIKKLPIKDFNVTGRVKHIYSIYHKMLRKGMSFESIYDITALRILVPTIADCYTLLSILQNTWQQIPEEFDDYIAHPKANGYRSIHMVFYGPEEKVIEVQIRTHEMHQESELGVAAHWRYKEGVLQTSGYEAKIALLRQIMAWQKEVASGDGSSMPSTSQLTSAATEQSISPTQDLFADAIYVFTPTGDVIDLPKNATPLDFAYHIHSEVGHRCRGAKINGHIAALTTALQTGDQVEILTAKQANPSRDWLNPHYGYLTTSRARAKVQHWFRIHDSIETSTGEQRGATGLNTVQHRTTSLGSLPHVIHGHFQTPVHPQQTNVAVPSQVSQNSAAATSAGEVKILGMSKLMTHFARCCCPNPGDAIVGYITQARGVSIHKVSCSNVKNIRSRNPARMIAVEWEK